MKTYKNWKYFSFPYSSLSHQCDWIFTKIFTFNVVRAIIGISNVNIHRSFLYLIGRWGKCKTGCRRRRKKFKKRKKSTKRRCKRLISTILNTWRIWPRYSKSVKRWRRSGYSSSKRSSLAFINASIYLRIRCKWVVILSLYIISLRI